MKITALTKRIAALAASGVAILAVGALSLWRRRVLPSSISHLRVGQVWEYDVSPEGETERAEVVESWPLPDGRQAFRVEYRRGERALDAVFTNDDQGRMIQLSQAGNGATFDPPLVCLGRMRVGERWSTTSWMVFPSMFRASSPTEVSGEVVGFESITVPAGTFDAFRIELTTNGLACVGWHVPGIGLVREVSENGEIALRRHSP